jgi:outer membrane protein assembly factor BamB
VPGTTQYLGAVRADSGLIYGLTDDGRYYAFDPVARETVHAGTLPGKRLRFPYLHDEPVGEDGLLVGLADDLAYAIDPSDHSVRTLAQHDALRAHGFYVTGDGVLYCGRGSDLWRLDLLGE